MFPDLQTTLANWPYDPEKISVRKILGVANSVKLQMRVELGIIQMETDGRPDGMRPFGCKSLLEYHQKKLEKYEQRNGTTLGYSINPQDCYSLRLEGALFYRRYVSYFVLEEYDNLVKDTEIGLAILDLCRDYGMEQEDRESLEEFRTYIIMMRTRGLTLKAMEEKNTDSALAHINRGIMEIKTFDDETYDSEDTEEYAGNELQVLYDLKTEICDEDSVMITRKALRKAIESEQFEEAAKLRDKLEHEKNWRKVNGPHYN